MLAVCIWNEMTVDEVLEHAAAVVKEAGSTDNLPSLPVINENISPERVFGRLPADNAGPVQLPPEHTVL